jgi:hypothetical protein
MHEPLEKLTPDPVVLIRLHLICWLVILAKCFILGLVVTTTVHFAYPYIKEEKKCA